MKKDPLKLANSIAIMISKGRPKKALDTEGDEPKGMNTPKHDDMVPCPTCGVASRKSKHVSLPEEV